SGIPILFPFPNRICDGRYTWNGKEYTLPLNDSTGKNAIHGFVCRKPWRRRSYGADLTSAWLSAEFTGSHDAPESLAHWPSDYYISITFRFTKDQLAVDAFIANPGNHDLPWGLGYHPYFTLAPYGGPEATTWVPASQFWKIEENLPTGQLLPVAD